MFNLDPAKLLIIAVVAILLLGPDKLPELARQVGGAWRSFGEFRHRMETDVRSSIPDLPSTADLARLARSPSAMLNHLSTMSSGDDGSGASTAVPVPAGSSSEDIVVPPIPGVYLGPEPDRANPPDRTSGLRSEAMTSADPTLN
jgi:TatA/E family protein of Tat protein translocase